MTTLLVADIGGTKSELAIYALPFDPHSQALQQQRYLNRDYSDFNAILNDFLHGSPAPAYGCLGVAAVVSNGVADLTNLDWSLSEKKLQTQFGFKQVTLINDLTATCSYLPQLTPNDLLTIQQGNPVESGIFAVIAPGTGLGEGFLISAQDMFFPQGTEGGHTDFAPLNHEQDQLLTHMRKRYKAVSYELLCSGLGIPNIYDFFATTERERDHQQTTIIEQARDRTAAIVQGVQSSPPCPLCRKTLHVFLEILGAEAGNVALKTYCTNGLFIGGGILPRMASKVSFAPFLDTFTKKEKMEELMATIPVHIITQSHIPMLGAAQYGHHLFSHQTSDSS